jgi:hydrogenase maturation protease
MSQRVVIGYGNTLRGDDGAGWQIAAALQALALPQLEVAAVHQLTPELAARLASADQVVFVDARHGMPGQPLALEPLQAGAPPPPFSHQLSPQALLLLSQELYGRQPQAWQLLIPGQTWAYREGVSAGAAAAMEEAMALVLAWIQQEPGHA